MSKPYRPTRIASIALFMAGRTHRIGLGGEVTGERGGPDASNRDALELEPVPLPEPVPGLDPSLTH